VAIDTDRIDDAVLALLHLTLHDEDRAWKGFDWDALARLHRKGMIGDPVGQSKSVILTPEGVQRSKELFDAMFAERPARAAEMGSKEPAGAARSPKYPHVKVDLTDLGDQVWPILRRVSYAMSDADVDDAEIEQYKNEVKSSADPVGVSRRWVRIGRGAD
jgi:uncharacterized protein DUF6429